jgi:hypothetical protein
VNNLSQISTSFFSIVLSFKPSSSHKSNFSNNDCNRPGTTAAPNKFVSSRDVYQRPYSQRQRYFNLFTIGKNSFNRYAK